MDPLPPSNNNNNNGAPAGKGEIIRENEPQEVDIIGNDLRDVGAVTIFILFGLARWLLREICTC